MNNRNKALIITGILIFITGIVALLVGGWLDGWDFAAYFKSPGFMWVAILLGIYILVVVFVLVKDWIDHKI